MNDYSLLIVDDEITQLNMLANYLKKQGFQVFKAANGNDGLAILRQHMIDIVLTDYRMPEMNGLEFIGEIKHINPEIDIILITAFGNIEDAVEVMKAGATDYLQKPIDLDYLDIIIRKVLDRKQILSENRILKESLQTKYNFHQLLSGSAAMESVLSMAARAAQSRATILLRGESGTGKEVLARAIHHASLRKDKPFIAVNVTAVPENLVESEFFGHEKGAFTGADRQRKGRFEMAESGTLFIDEIGDIPLSTQVKLLRVLQERRFERVGGAEELTVDVRVIAATNQNLERLIQQGKFREDLFYRLNVISITLPALRERREEIPLFIDHFTRKFCEQENRPPLTYSKEALDLLLKYHYPGNVRELENIIQRAVVLARDDLITTSDLAIQLQELPDEANADTTTSLPRQVEALEKQLITNALRQSEGNQSQAARLLGITERNLRYKIRKYSLK